VPRRVCGGRERKATRCDTDWNQPYAQFVSQNDKQAVVGPTGGGKVDTMKNCVFKTKNGRMQDKFVRWSQVLPDVGH
jgi:hypothetical protein